VGAAFFFVKTYDQYSARQEKALALAIKFKALESQKIEMARRSRTLLAVKRFMDRAHDLGLEKDRWIYYDVNIQEPVSFPEMEQILNQCNNSTAAYYKPISLQIKKMTSDRVQATDRATSRSASSSSAAKTDLLITLSGKFLARPE
jgi:hypothetical protein